MTSIFSDIIDVRTASNLFRYYERRTITAILIPQCPGCDCAIAMAIINNTAPSITGLCFIMWNID